MKTEQSNPQLKVVVEQVANNTTAWMGHRLIPSEDIIAGQTFTCPAEGDLAAIEIFFFTGDQARARTDDRTPI